MPIKVILELEAKPGKRAELKSLPQSVETKFASGQPGFLDSTYYEVLDNPNMLVEIADWHRLMCGQRPCGGYGHRCLRTSGGVVSRTIQSYGHQVTVLTDVRGSMSFVSILTGHGQKVIHSPLIFLPKLSLHQIYIGETGLN